MKLEERLHWRTKKPNFDGWWVFSNNKPTRDRIDVWFQEEFIGSEAPKAVDITIMESGRCARGQTEFSLKMDKPGNKRPRWISEDLGADGKPLVTGLYIPERDAVNAPSSLKLCVSRSEKG